MCVASDKGKEKNEKGIPNFWLEAMKNLDLVSDMIQDNDEDVLKSLIDITMNIENDPMVGTFLEVDFLIRFIKVTLCRLSRFLSISRPTNTSPTRC